MRDAGTSKIHDSCLSGDFLSQQSHLDHHVLQKPMATASAISFNLFLYQNLWSLQHPVAMSPADQACKRVLPLYLLPDHFTGNALILAILQKSDSRLSVHLHHFMFIHSIPVDSLPNGNVLVSVVTLLLCKVSHTIILPFHPYDRLPHLGDHCSS